TYPVRWRRTNPAEFGFNQSRMFPDVGVRGYVAFINERFDGRGLGPGPSRWYIDRRSMTGGDWGVFGLEGSRTMPGQRDMAVFSVGPRTGLTLVNTTFYDAAPAHTANKFALVNYEGGGVVNAVGSMWGFRANDTGTFMVSMGDGAIGADAHLFT